MKASDVPGVPPLPAWVDDVSPRWKLQLEAAERILDAYTSGTSVVFLDAPTGSGKTLIAELVRRMLNQRTLYVCNTKSLQDQFMADFPYAKVLKGRSNYPTVDQPAAFNDRFARVTAADCNKEMRMVPACSTCPNDGTSEEALHCWTCHPVADCPYELAKNAVLAAPLGVLNTAYFLTEANYIGRFSLTSDATPSAGFIVLDECDTLESNLMNFVEVDISPRLRKELDLPVPTKKTVASSWAAWLDDALPIVARARDRLANTSDPDLSTVRASKTVANLFGQLGSLRGKLDTGEWIYTGYDKGRITFKPVTVSANGQNYIFQHAGRWLMMSATPISCQELADSLGLENSWTTVTMPSTFPASRRPLHVVPVAPMTKNAKESSWPLMADAVNAVLAKHPDERILVHTVSYDLTTYLHDHMSHDHRHRCVLYGSSDEREAALKAYREQPGAVLLAPSFDRGIDLPDDLCRVVVVCKIPYPYLGDKQVAARLYSSGGDMWYQVQTVRSLVQMTGRGMRHEEDTCTTYILDEQFLAIWRKSKRLLPDWWTDALEWSGGALRVTNTN